MIRLPSLLSLPRGEAHRKLALLAVAWIGASLPLAGGADAQRFGRNKIQYDNFDWKVLSTPHFEIFFYPEEEALAARAAVIAEDAYVRISELFDHEFSSQVPFILYASPNDFQQTNISDGLIGEGTGGFSEPLRNRMVLPYPGDNQGFIHVINHELIHVFMFDIAWKSTGPGRARRQIFPIPLWFAEGAAEWFSTGWDLQADMWLRDATIHGWVVPLTRIYGGFQVYKEGQSAMRYIAETYGRPKVVEFFKSVGRTGNVERSVNTSFGLSMKKFDENWRRWLKHDYWELYAEKQELEEVGIQLTDHAENGNYFFQQPAISPDGRTIAFFSDNDGFPELYLMDAIEQTIIRKLATGYRSNDFLSLHSFDSGISFSPDSKRIAFIAKSGGDEVLYVINVEDGSVENKMKLPTEIARSPDWSPVADQVVFSGTEGGQTDLYLVDLNAKKVQRLTNDVADEHAPAWFPDGKRIVFSSYPNTTVDIRFERGEKGTLNLAPVDFERSGNVSHVGVTFDIQTMDLTTGTSELLISTTGADTEPVVWDEDTVLFVSDANGIQNLYEYRISEGSVRRLTDVLGGIFQPDVSREANTLVFSAFTQAGWDIVLNESFSEYAAQNEFPIETEIEMISIYTNPSADEPSVADSSRVSDGNGIRLPISIPTPGSVALSTNASEHLVAQVAQTEEEHAEDGEPSELSPAQVDSALATLDRVPVEPEPKFEPRRPIGTVEPYKLRFSLDPVGSGFGGVYYSSGVGLGIANVISLSDLMGNHRMSFLVNFYGSLKYSDLAAGYSYRKRRINYSGGIFHYRNYINSNFTSLGEIYDRTQRFSERNYGAFVRASLPMTQFDRVDFELQSFVSEKEFYETDDGFTYKKTDTTYDTIFQPSLSFSHDSAFYGPHGPVTGSRYSVSFAPTAPLFDRDVDRATSYIDLRKYMRLFGSRQSIAVRATAAQSTGKTPRYFVVGGPGTLRGYDTFDFERTDGPNNPRYNNLVGNKMLLFNIEYRFPLIDALYLGWPGSWGIGGIGGTVFFDMGSAFEGDLKPWGEAPNGDFRLDGLNADFGFGIRTNVAFLPLKFDWAWKTDMNSTAPHVQYNFSIAPEF